MQIPVSTVLLLSLLFELLRVQSCEDNFIAHFVYACSRLVIVSKRQAIQNTCNSSAFIGRRYDRKNLLALGVALNYGGA